MLLPLLFLSRNLRSRSDFRLTYIPQLTGQPIGVGEDCLPKRLSKLCLAVKSFSCDLGESGLVSVTTNSHRGFIQSKPEPKRQSEYLLARQSKG